MVPLWVPSLDAALYAARDAAGAPVEATSRYRYRYSPRLMLGLLVEARSTRRRSPYRPAGLRSGGDSGAYPLLLPGRQRDYRRYARRPNHSLQILRVTARSAPRTGAGGSPPRCLGRIARKATCLMSRARRTPCTSRSSGSSVCPKIVSPKERLP